MPLLQNPWSEIRGIFNEIRNTAEGTGSLLTRTMKEMWHSNDLAVFHHDIDEALKRMPNNGAQMPADQYMDSLRLITEADNTSTVIRVFGYKEDPAKENPLLENAYRVSQKLISFVAESIERMPAEASQKMASHTVENDNIAHAAKKHPETTITALGRIIAKASPDEHRKIIEIMESNKFLTTLILSTDNPDHTADLFLEIAQGGGYSDETGIAKRYKKIGDDTSVPDTLQPLH